MRAFLAVVAAARRPFADKIVWPEVVGYNVHIPGKEKRSIIRHHLLAAERMTGAPWGSVYMSITWRRRIYWIYWIKISMEVRLWYHLTKCTRSCNVLALVVLSQSEERLIVLRQGTETSLHSRHPVVIPLMPIAGVRISLAGKPERVASIMVHTPYSIGMISIKDQSVPWPMWAGHSSITFGTLWDILSFRKEALTVKITHAMVESTYRIARKIYTGDMSRVDGKVAVSKETGMVEGSADDYITVFLAMMNGEEYHRTINTAATDS